MKNWNASASKFYSELMNGFATFFGLNAEETTEAELHQQLIEAGSLAEIRANAMNEANATVMKQMADFQSQLDALTAKVGELESDAEAKGAKVIELESDLEAVRGQLSEKETALADRDGQIQKLSGEVAGLKAGKPLGKDQPADQSKPFETGRKDGSGRVVSMQEIEAYLN